MGMLWRGSHKFRGPVDFLRGVSGVDPTMAPGDVVGLNKHYFVNPTTGSDTANDGKSWHSPFATFEKGIDACRFDPGTTTIADDKSQRAYLFLAPGHYNETTQLLFSAYNVSVIGCGIPVPGKDYGVSLNYDGSSATAAAVLLGGSGIELCNVHIYCDAAIPALWLYNGDNNYIHDVVIECDGTNCTYGIQTGGTGDPNSVGSMKGSRIERVVITGAKTAGIYVAGDANDYFINGWIRDCLIHSAYSNTKGIYVASTVTAYNSLIDHNFVTLTSGASCKGIDVDCSGGPLVTNNYVSVPSTATPIEHAGGDQFLMGNHTAAGTVNADPFPTAA